MSVLVAERIELSEPQMITFTVEEYQKLGEMGFFAGREKVELINGKIYDMSPLTPDHNGHVDKVSRFFSRTIYDKTIIRTQGSIRATTISEPEPDITILRFAEHFYSKKQATSEDTLMVIEVAVFSVKHDRTVKKKLYAQAGIAEYWIVIPKKQIIEVYRDPEHDDYNEKKTYKIKDSWTIEQFDLEVKGSDFLIE